jgi:hypothetical protein
MDFSAFIPIGAIFLLLAINVLKARKCKPCMGEDSKNKNI